MGLWVVWSISKRFTTTYDEADDGHSQPGGAPEVLHHVRLRLGQQFGAALTLRV